MRYPARHRRPWKPWEDALLGPETMLGRPIPARQLARILERTPAAVYDRKHTREHWSKHYVKELGGA